MKGLVLRSFLITSTGVALFGGCDGQPKAPCAVVSAQFAARLRYAAGPDSCRTRVADTFAVQSYARSLPDKRPSLERAKVAILPSRIYHHREQAGGDGDRNPEHRPTAEGQFVATYPDERDVCRAEFLGDAVQELPAVPEVPGDPKDLSTFDRPALPATSYRYHFTDMEFYVAEGAVGTQLRGKVDVTIDGEACGYELHALSPAVPCGDVDGADPSHRTTRRNDAQCTEAAKPDLQRQKTIGSMPVGTYINPDYPTACTETPTLDVQGYPTQFVCLLPESAPFPPRPPASAGRE